jgi:Cu-processing system permease protein
LLGKYLGLVAIVGANLVLITVVLMAMVLIYSGQWDPMLIFAAAMTMLEMAVLAAFAIFFAVLTKPILGSLMTLSVFFVGHLSADLWLLTRQLPGAFARGVIAVIYYLVPNLERFDFKVEVVHNLPIPPAAVGWAVVYALAFVVVVLFLANLRFRSKDLR